MRHTGVVEKVYKKTGTARTGKPYTLFSAKVSGLQQWASFGFKDPGVKEGETVLMEGEIDGNNFKVSRHKVTDAHVQTVAPNKPVSAGGNRDDYWKDKERRDIEVTQPRIQYQSARKDALEFMNILFQNEALPITTAANKGGKAKRFEELEAILDKLTVRFFHDTETLRVLDRVQDSEEEPAKAAPLPKAEPVADDFDADEHDSFGVNSNDIDDLNEDPF